MILIYICFALFALYFRLKPLLSSEKCHISPDEAFHFYYIELMKKNSHTVPDHNKNVFGGPNECTYPAFYHLILSYLPIKFVKKYGKFTSLIYDFLTGCLLYSTLFKYYSIDVDHIFLIIGLYLVFPSLIFYSIGPRSYSLTPRNFSQFLCACGYLGLIHSFFQVSFLWLQISAICFAINILTSKFFIQYILLIGIFMCGYSRSMEPFYFLLNIIVWALIIGKTRLYKQLKGQVEHSWWYIKDGIKFIQERWQWKTMFNYLIHMKIRKLWQIIMFHNPVTRGIILNLPLILYLIFYLSFPSYDATQKFSLTIIVASLFFFGLTQFSFFKVFGEPERYIEYSFPSFLFILFSKQVSEEFILLTVIYCLILCAYDIRIRKKGDITSMNKDIDEITQALQRFSDKNILCTLNNETYIFSNPKDKILIGAFVNNKRRAFYYYFYDIYPDVNHKNFQHLIKDYDVTHVIINKKRKMSEAYNTKNLDLILENNHYKLFFRKPIEKT